MLHGRRNAECRLVTAVYTIARSAIAVVFLNRADSRIVSRINMNNEALSAAATARHKPKRRSYASSVSSAQNIYFRTQRYVSRAHYYAAVSNMQT